jgi:cellulose synthase/poly-beta-1,6-N-acetylglucosamine synthase-like glycosyltransferase
MWRAQAADSSDEAPTLAVLMPAHDEATVIAQTVAQVRPHLRPHDRLLVVADNCTDTTAEVARAAGAEVVERTDPVLRGKGYALAHGLACLTQRPPQVVLVVDADCRVAPGALQRLATRAWKLQRPVQGLNLMQASVGSGLQLRVAAFAWALRNHVRALGYKCLGLPCQLMGTGMAFPWPLVQRVSFATGHIVEDLTLGLTFAAMGRPPYFCPEAVVVSDFPANEEGMQSQRKRWEHGHLTVLMQDAPRYLLQALWQRNGGLSALVLDMSVPPLALLTVLCAAYAALGGVVAWQTGVVWPLAVGACACAALLGAVLLGWMLVGRAWVRSHELLLVPVYILRKLPLYVAFLFKRQVAWVKTRRE